MVVVEWLDFYEQKKNSLFSLLRGYIDTLVYCEKFAINR